MPRLILVRHGITDWNAAQRYQGHGDICLNDVGCRQARALARRLMGEEIQAAYCSDLCRARQTAKLILCKDTVVDGDMCAWDSPVPCTADARLRELNFGRWQGMTYDEIGQSYPRALAIWRADPMTVAPPEGERAADLVARVGAALRTMVGAHGSQTVLVVAHGGSLQALVALALGVTPRFPGQFRMEPGSVSELLVSSGRFAGEGTATLTLLNDTHHFKDLHHDG